eukprot:321422-Chlamydomonas_euryale.AAC.1
MQQEPNHHLHTHLKPLTANPLPATATQPGPSPTDNVGCVATWQQGHHYHGLACIHAALLLRPNAVSKALFLAERNVAGNIAVYEAVDSCAKLGAALLTNLISRIVALISADNSSLLADSPDDLVVLSGMVYAVALNTGFFIHAKKTEIMRRWETTVGNWGGGKSKSPPTAPAMRHYIKFAFPRS